MREFKFKYFFEQDGKIRSKIYNLVELAGGCMLDDLSALTWNIISKCQYTGLKDKNGVEIYEGDLLKPFYDNGEIYEVIWHEESSSFRVATYLDNCHGGTFAELFFMDDINEECNEIIGNIYENSELLKED